MSEFTDNFVAFMTHCAAFVDEAVCLLEDPAIPAENRMAGAIEILQGLRGVLLSDEPVRG